MTAYETAQRRSSSATATMSAAIVLASAGRPELLAAAMHDAESQDVGTVRVLSVPDARSLPGGAAQLSGWTVVTGTRGLAAQRNAGVAAVGDVDVVFFFDDDSVVREDYVRHGIAFFSAHPEVVGITGRVLLDGASTGEVDPDRARTAVAASRLTLPTGASRRSRELYGCNFAYRTAAADGLRFDDRLPLYSWLEDHDFARRLMRRGRLRVVDDCVVVHRGAASGGRQAHTRLGYAQVMNPAYLWRTGSFPAWLAAWEIFRPVAKSALRSLGGPEAGWRRERLRGNLLAARDLLRGRFTPERMAEL